MDIEGIILAAGLSSRAGTYKMTLEFKGRTIIENVIEEMLSHVQRIIVVGGYRIEILKPVVEKYEKVELVFNENYEEGMFSSVKKGISNIKGDRFFITPGDYPLIENGVYKKLLGNDGDIVIPVYDGKRGHPVLIKSSLINKINSNNYLSLRDFIKDSTPVMVPVDCPGILVDIDTMDDYRGILKYEG